MASQSAGTGDHRNTDRSIYAALPSICRAADRHDPEGISGPDAVLDNGGSCSNSNIIITATERTPDEEDACQSQVLKDHWQRQNRVCIGGKNTVEDCIRLQSPHEIRNSPCTGFREPGPSRNRLSSRRTLSLIYADVAKISECLEGGVTIIERVRVQLSRRFSNNDPNEKMQHFIGEGTLDY